MYDVVGFIGTGSMGGALARACAKAIDPGRILLSSRGGKSSAALARELGAGDAGNAAIARNADMIFLGIKPQGMEELFAEIAPELMMRSSPFVLVSMAAGVSTERIRRLAGGNCPVIRMMPNMPCSIGEGVLLYCCQDVDSEGEAAFLGYMAKAGRLTPLPERLLDAGCALSGCGPAFVQIFLEAMADGGVACGLGRPEALELAAQTLLGSARLCLEGGSHPALLKDAVCSPGGATIQGVRALEKAGFRSAVMEAVIASWERSTSLG